MTYYQQKVYFLFQKTCFSAGKVWPRTKSAWICIGLAPWIRIRIIATEDPQHCWLCVRLEWSYFH
jgi:hypothetical protein